MGSYRLSVAIAVVVVLGPLVRVPCRSSRADVPYIGTIKVTPAVEAGIADHVWELEEMVGLMGKAQLARIGTESNKRGPYKPRSSN